MLTWSADAWRKEVAPYRHWTCESAVCRSALSDVGDWIRRSAAWRRNVGPFYDQFDCQNVLGPASPFCGLLPSTERYCQLIEELTGDSVQHILHVGLHLLVPGQAIGLHSDAPAGGRETHRIVLMLGSLGNLVGGEFVLASGEGHTSSFGGYEHSPGAALLLPLQSGAKHAVSNIRDGLRFSAVLSFWASDVEGADVPRASAAHASTDPPRWQVILEVLRRCGHAARVHSGGSLVAHLFGTYEILRSWGCAHEVCLAGLCHSVYGTRRFAGQVFGDRERGGLRSLIGDRAEELVKVYSRLDCRVLRRRVLDARRLTDRDHALLAIDIANELEQVPRLGLDKGTKEYVRIAMQQLGKVAQNPVL